MAFAVTSYDGAVGILSAQIISLDQTLNLPNDDTELDTESTKIPLLHNKYLQHYNKFSLLLKKAEYEHKVMQRQKWEYYTGKADPSIYKEKPFDLKVLKADVHIYMDSDDELQKADQKAAYLKQVVTYLEQVLRSINNRTFLKYQKLPYPSI